MQQKPHLVIIGASGHAKVVLDVVQREGRYEVVGLLDSNKIAGTVCGDFEVLGPVTDLPRLRSRYPDLCVIVAVGDNWTRARLASQVQSLCPGISFGRAVHPSAQIGSDVAIGQGTVIMAGVVVNAGASIGEGCILNTGCSLDHDSSLGDYSSLGPSAVTGGGAHIGANTAVGIHAAVLQEISVGDDTVVGAGATVVRPIPDRVVAYGTPARVVRSREPGDSYLRAQPARGAYPFLKRATDVVVSTIALLLLSPIIALVALAVRIGIGSPVLFRQARPGLGEEIFNCLKFRTMTDARDADGDLLADDLRLTALGRFLRRTSLDELPQLWSVLVGDMSLVGPRPLLIRYLPRYSPEQRRRHLVRPGITGWAQVHGRNTIDWDRKLALDVWYVDNCSFSVDLKVIVMTLGIVLTAAGVARPGQVSMEEFWGTQATHCYESDAPEEDRKKQQH